MRWAVIFFCALGCGCSGNKDQAAQMFVLGIKNGPCGGGSSSSVSSYFGEIPLRVEFTGTAGIQRVTAVIEGKGQLVIDDTPPFQLNLDTKGIDDGSAKLEIEGIGPDFSLTKSFEICIDNNKPTLKVVSPVANQVVYLEDAELEVRVSEAKDNAGVSLIRATMNVAGKFSEVQCAPAEGPDATCLLKPQDLGLTLDPGVTKPLTLTISVRDKASREGSITVLLTAKSRLKWTYKADDVLVAEPVFLDSGDAVVVSRFGHVFRISPAGEVRCNVALDNPGNAERLTAPPAVDSSGAIVFVAMTNSVQAINATTCQRITRTAFANGIFSGSRPYFDKARNVVFVGSTGLSTTKGALLPYRFTAPSTFALVGTGLALSEDGGRVGSPLLGADGTTVFVGSTKKEFYAVNAATLNSLDTLWTVQANDDVAAAPLQMADTLFWAGSTNKLFALNRNNGAEVAGFNAVLDAVKWSGVVQNSKKQLVAGNGITLYLIDSVSGRVQAKTDVGVTERSIPAIDNVDNVYVKSSLSDPRTPGERLLVFTPSMRLKWRVRLSSAEPQSEVISSPVLRNGFVYVVSENNTLYALDAAN